MNTWWDKLSEVMQTLVHPRGINSRQVLDAKGNAMPSGKFMTNTRGGIGKLYMFDGGCGLFLESSRDFMHALTIKSRQLTLSNVAHDFSRTDANGL